MLFRSGTKKVAANRCWMECNIAQANEITLKFEDPTGINNTPASVQSKNIYNIDGMHLNAPQKGINIVDKKKILVK